MLFPLKDHHSPGSFFQALEQRCCEIGPLVTAVVHPVSPESLKGAVESHKKKIIEAVLIGPQKRIEKTAEEAGINLKGIKIVPTLHSHAAAAKAVELAEQGEVNCLMKGALHTSEFLGAVVHSTDGLKTERRLSHVFYFDIPSYHKPLIVTDSAVNIIQDLAVKKDILQNAFDFAHALGIENPKAALLSAVETVEPGMESTIEAAALCKMVDRRQITGGIADGPLAFDNALSKESARTKGIESPVAGDPDILLAPNLEAANILAKQLIYLEGAMDGGIVMGARIPIILTSRSADAASRLRSSYLARLFHYYASTHYLKYLGH